MVNSLFNLNINRSIHVIFVIFIIVSLCVVYKLITTLYRKTHYIDGIFLLAFAGSICSLIDKLFWGGSLDYILFKGLFIFDLKDIYLTIIELVLIISLITNYKKIRAIDEKKLLFDFKEYIKLEVKKLKNKVSGRA